MPYIPFDIILRIKVMVPVRLCAQRERQLIPAAGPVVIHRLPVPFSYQPYIRTQPGRSECTVRHTNPWRRSSLTDRQRAHLRYLIHWVTCGVEGGGGVAIHISEEEEEEGCRVRGGGGYPGGLHPEEQGAG